MLRKKVTFIGNIALAYCLVVGFIGSLLYLSYVSEQAAWAAKPQIIHTPPKAKPAKTISGYPARIILPSASIDLPVDIGGYDKASGTWTLSPNNAEFAMQTMIANNTAGMTFIYGHGTAAVFGKIGESPPPIGTIAKLYTSNGRIFTYILQDVHNFQSTDTSIFRKANEGAPRLVIQTCTGTFDEWRTMFTFSLKDVQ